MPIQLRPGTQADLPAVLQLVRELAAYERAADQVEVTLAQMEQWRFGPQPRFAFFVAELQGQVVGMALYYYKYSTWKGPCLFLEDIVVTATARGKGIGRQLFNAVKAVARESQVKRMEWQVLHWNESAIAFYRQFNSSFDGEWLNCRLTYEQLQA